MRFLQLFEMADGNAVNVVVTFSGILKLHGRAVPEKGIIVAPAHAYLQGREDRKRVTSDILAKIKAIRIYKLVISLTPSIQATFDEIMNRVNSPSVFCSYYLHKIGCTMYSGERDSAASPRI